MISVLELKKTVLMVLFSVLEMGISVLKVLFSVHNVVISVPKVVFSVPNMPQTRVYLRTLTLTIPSFKGSLQATIALL